MKPLLIFIILIQAAVIAYLLVVEEPHKCSEPSIKSTEAIYATSLDTAKECIQRYIDMSRKYLGDSTPVRGFTIRSVDLLESLGVPLQDTICAKYTHIRAYLGMKQNNDFKLFLTPVIDSNLRDNIPGVDVILNGNFRKYGDTETSGSGEYVLDLIAPCPNSCDPSSPLYVND